MLSKPEYKLDYGNIKDIMERADKVMKLAQFMCNTFSGATVEMSESDTEHFKTAIAAGITDSYRQGIKDGWQIGYDSAKNEGRSGMYKKMDMDKTEENE